MAKLNVKLVLLKKDQFSISLSIVLICAFPWRDLISQWSVETTSQLERRFLFSYTNYNEVKCSSEKFSLPSVLGGHST